MLYGLYLSAQGAQNQNLRLQTISNNVANADTTGFKRDLAVFQDHLPFDLEQGNPSNPPGNLNRSTGGTTIARTHTDFTNGPLIKTDGTYDVALTGPGFLQEKQGSEMFLTRNGQLSVNDLGEIVTQDQGLPVLSTQGASIVVPQGASRVNISPDGIVFAANPAGEQIPLGQLEVVQPAALDDLQKMGGSLYRAEGPVVPVLANVQIRQGYLEASGVNPISETVQLIEASRSFETNINMIRFQDESLSRLLQSMTRR
jgi:flagellar basal body rod protein FlgG